MTHNKLILEALQNFDYLPDSANIRPKPCAQLMGVSIATFWRLVSSGKLKTHKLTERTTTVRVGDLRKLLAGNSKENV